MIRDIAPLIWVSILSILREGLAFTTTLFQILWPLALQPDLLKLPFPVDPSDPDEDHWYGACRAISEIATMPWVLLSGGGSFDAYAKQVEVAVAAGGSGFMVGRALWGEAALAPADDRVALLADVVRPRMQRLRALID